MAEVPLPVVCRLGCEYHQHHEINGFGHRPGHAGSFFQSFFITFSDHLGTSIRTWAGVAVPDVRFSDHEPDELRGREKISRGREPDVEDSALVVSTRLEDAEWKGLVFLSCGPDFGGS